MCIYIYIYTGVHITGTQERMREDNQQYVMPLVLLRAFAYLTDLILIVSTQQHVIYVSTCRVNTSLFTVSRAAELRCRRVRAHRDGAQEKEVTCTPPPPVGGHIYHELSSPHFRVDHVMNVKVPNHTDFT